MSNFITHNGIEMSVCLRGRVTVFSYEGIGLIFFFNNKNLEKFYPYLIIIGWKERAFFIINESLVFILYVREN